MNGAEALRTICASLAAALALCALACLLPDNPYQRWQLADRPLFDTLQWAYERIHFDDRPIDVVVVGPSRTFFGVSMPEVEQRLSERGQPVHVANFSVPGEGRNLHWAVLAEVFKVKSPKVVVVGVSEPRTEFGIPSSKRLLRRRRLHFRRLLCCIIMPMISPSSPLGRRSYSSRGSFPNWPAFATRSIGKLMRERSRITRPVILS